MEQIIKDSDQDFDQIEKECQTCQMKEAMFELFICKACNGSGIFCLECGIYLHNRQKKDHKFEPPNIESTLKDAHRDSEKAKQAAENKMNEKTSGSIQTRRNKVGQLVHSTVTTLSPYLYPTTRAVWQSLAVDATVLNAKTTSKLMANSAIATAGIASGAICLLEIGWLSLRYFDIAGKSLDYEEYKRLVVRSITSNAVTFGASYGGAVGGAAVGALIGSVVPVIGTALGGIIGGILGAIASSITAGIIHDKCFDHLWPDNEKKFKAQMKKDAFKEFGIKEDEINQIALRTIKLKYKLLCKVHHPDKGGSVAKFQEIQIYYGLLMALKDQPEHEVQQEMLAIELNSISKS